MDEKNKARWDYDLKMIGLIVLGIIAILSSVGCFNYAVVAKKVGKPENFFWFVGIVNLCYNALMIIRIAKTYKQEKK